LGQSQENDVYDQEHDCGRPEDSVEANRAIETAKDRLQGVGPDNREHGDRHQSNGP
jgi:hypothetical protein